MTHSCSKVAILTLKLRHHVLDKHRLQLTFVLLPLQEQWGQVTGRGGDTMEM